VRRAVPSREPTQAWIRALSPARAGIPEPTRAGSQVPVRARILARTRAVLRVTASAGLLVEIRGVFLAAARVGSRTPVRAVASHPAAGLVPGLAFVRNLVRGGWPDRATVRHLAPRSPPRLARRPPRTQRARGGPVTPIRVSARGLAPGPGRIPVPGQAPAGLDQDQIPGPVAVRRPGSARAPTPGSALGPGRTARPRRGVGLAPTAGHDLMPRAALAWPRRPGLHGLLGRNGRAAVPAPASVPRTGTAAAGRPVRPASQGRAAGAPSRVPNHCRPARARRPCRARPSALGAAVATVPAAARMRAALRKRWRGKRARDTAAGGAAGPSSRPQRTVRPRWAVMPCWAAMRRRAATRYPAGPRRRAMTCRRAATRYPAGPRHRDMICRRDMTGRHAVAHCAAGTRRRGATRPAAGRAKAGPLGGDALRAGARRPPGRGTLVPRRRGTSGSRTKPGLAGEGHGAGPRISGLPWTRPARTTGPAAARGPPGPVPGPAGAGAAPCCWPCWRSWSSRPGRRPR
jgi:hypothetical protein